MKTRFLGAAALVIMGAAAVAVSAPAAFASDGHAASAVSAPMEGDLRISGSTQLRPLLQAWAAEFRRRNPGVRVVDRLRGNASGIYGLEQRTSDIALMGRDIHPFERYGVYERSWTYPLGIQIATGGLDGETGAYFAVVHKDNPISSLGVDQLDGVFGASRVAGWDKLAWNVDAGRDASADIRTWKQLGVSGRLSRKPITPYLVALMGAGALTDFQLMAMRGGATFNEQLREYPTRDAVLAALVNDPAGIAVVTAGDLPAGLKPVPLAKIAGQRAVIPSEASLADRSYPLARPVYAFVTIDDEEGGVADPHVKPMAEAFIRFILSPDGQRIASAHANYVPLPADEAARQKTLLESQAWPVERPRP